MKPSNFNVIIFDEEDRQSRDSRAHPAKAPQQYDIIEQELHFLADKVKHLEQQTDALAFARNDSNLINKSNAAHSEPTPAHSRELLMAIEKKIQIIVKETRKIVDKLGENFEKKLESKVAKKYDELGIGKIKENYSLTLKKIEENYRREIERVSRQHREVENKMVGKLGEIEQKMLNRMNEFDIREKEYVDWIHHLQIQLKEKQSKSKKMIEITQQRGSRKEGSDNNSTINIDQNYSSIQPKQTNPASSNHISSNHITVANPNDSKVNRKHRIFDNAGKQPSSISPNPKSVSPLNSQPYTNNNAPLYSTKVINPIKSKEPEVERPPTISLATRQTEPLRSNEIQSSPWKVIDKSIEKSYEIPTRRNEVIKDVNADEFYRDVPKANQGWEKFQDFEENDSSSDSSSEDVLFYRQGDRQQEFVDHFRSSKFADSRESKEKDTRQIKNIFENKKPHEGNYQQKVFSPFDLN